MAKESFWFKHDYNARSDRRIMSLLMKTGVQGIGIYWCVIEMLYEEGGYLMRTDCVRIAFELRTDCENVTAVIESDLFQRDNERFWSDSVLRRLDKRHETSAKNSKTAKDRWEKERLKKEQGMSQNDANAMRTHSERTANAMQPQCEINATAMLIRGEEKRREENPPLLEVISKEVSSIKRELEVKIEVKESSQKKEFNHKPCFNDVIDYPEIKKGAVVEFFKRAKNVDVSSEQVEAYWVMFKHQYLTGQKFYQDESDIYTHFFSWVIKKDLSNAKQPNYTSTTTDKRKLTKDDAYSQFVNSGV